MVLALQTRATRAAGLAHDRDQQLAHQVTTEHECVDLVELRRVQELPICRLGSMDVARVEQTRRLAPGPPLPLNGISLRLQGRGQLVDVAVPLLPFADLGPQPPPEDLRLRIDPRGSRCDLTSDSS